MDEGTDGGFRVWHDGVQGVDGLLDGGEVSVADGDVDETVLQRS